jgi:hypothetical protein
MITDAAYAAALTLIDGLFAYDTGCVDSGIHDPVAKKALVEMIRAQPSGDQRIFLSKVMRDLFLTDKSIAQGYGWEDVRELATWYEDELH